MNEYEQRKITRPTPVGFSTSAKFLIVLGALSFGGLSLIVWNTLAGTQIGTTLKLSNAAGGLENGLVGHWTFDGKDMPGGQVNDTSGNGNNGSQVNMASSTAYVPGAIGQALNFDGTNDYLLLPNTAGLNVASAFTLSAWIYSEDPSAGSIQRIVSLSPSESGGIEKYSMYVQSNQFKTVIRLNGADYITSTVYSDSDYLRRRWRNVVMVYDGSQILMYSDGEGVGQRTQSGTLADASTNPLRIGAFGPTFGQYFKGKVDDVRIYNRALSLDEIKQLYQLGATTKFAITPKPTNAAGGINNGLVGYWTFDGKDMPGGLVKDISGQGNDGSERNMATSTMYVPGAIGQALKFDAADDVIQIPDSSSVRLSNSDWAISFWARTSTTSSNNLQIVSKRADANNKEYEIFLRPTGNFDVVVQVETSDSGEDANSVNNVWSLNTWNHFVVIMNTTTMNPRFFVNGAEVGVESDTITTQPTASAAPVNIGGRKITGSPYYDGTLDDIRMYNRMLSSDEVKQLYQLGATTKIATTPKPTSAVGGINNGLVGEWTFDGKDMFNGQIMDVSGNSNNGSMINMSTGTSRVAGQIGQALQFDGSNDEARIPQSALYPSGNAERSIAFWFNAGAFDTGIGRVLLTYAEVPAAGRDFSFCAEDRAVSLTFNAHRIITPKNTLNVGEWHHVVAVVPPGTTQTSGIKMYLDGNLATVTTEQGSAQTLNTVQSDIYIASETGAGFGNAKIDDLRIYNRAISSDEVKQLYQMGR